MNKKIAILIGMCLTFGTSLLKLVAQETSATRPQLFATVGKVPGLEQSWDGKFLRVMPYYDNEHPENYIPDSFWNVATRQKLPSSEQPVDFTRHNQVLDADKHGFGGFYCVRDLQTGRCTRLQNEKVRVFWPPHQFSPDGKKLTLVLSGVITRWDTASGKQLSRVRYAQRSNGLGSDGHYIGPTFSPDGARMADIAGWSRSSSTFFVKIIDAQTGKTRAVLPQEKYEEMSFSPDGRILETLIRRSSSGGKKLSRTGQGYQQPVHDLRFWDAFTGKPLWTWRNLQPELLRSGSSRYLGQFMPDGKLYGKPREHDFAVFEARTGQLIRVLLGPTSQCDAWTFSFDAKEIWSADREGHIWRRSAS